MKLVTLIIYKIGIVIYILKNQFMGSNLMKKCQKPG
jgi:hypothetical protein